MVDNTNPILTTEGTPGVAITTEQPSPLGLAVAPDKLAIINRALVLSGNNPVTVPDDNSEEWLVGSAAYDEWVPVLLRRRNWGFAKTFAPSLTRVADSMFPGFSDVFAKPANCLFLENVYRTDLAALVFPNLAYEMPEQDTRPPPLEYRIINDQVHCVAPYGVTAIYIPFPTGTQPWPAGFVTALRLKIQSELYYALAEDAANGARCAKEAEAAMEEEAARSENEAPRRFAYRSSVVEARRRRRGGYWSW